VISGKLNYLIQQKAIVQTGYKSNILKFQLKLLPQSPISDVAKTSQWGLLGRDLGRQSTQLLGAIRGLAVKPPCVGVWGSP